MKYIDNRLNANIVKLEDANNNYESENVEGALEEIDSRIKTIEANGYDDTQIKQDINDIKNEIGNATLNTDAINIKDAINEVNSRINTVEANAYDDTQIRQDINNVKTEIGTKELTTTDKTIKGAVNEIDSQIKEKANKTFINVKEFGAKGDGITDDTKAIQNAINSLHENDTLEIPEGNYFITDQLIVNKQKNRIQGKGCIILNNETTNGNLSVFCLSNSKDVYISDLSLKTNGFQEGCAVSILNKCSDITIDKLNINSFKNVGINSPKPEGNTNIKILNSNILKCKFGIAGSANGFIISNNYINNLWYESEEYKNTREWTADVPYYDGIIIDGENFIISNNIIEGNGQSGIYTGGAKGGTISSNTIKKNYNCGLDLGIVGEYNEPNNYIANITFTGNCVYDNRHHQVNITGVKNSVFTSNYVYNDSAIAFPVIFTNGSNGNLISNNILINKQNNSRGVSFDSSCNNNKIIFNSVESDIKYYRDGNNDIIDFNELTNMYNSLSINLSNLTGFNGRNLLNLVVSDDNDFGQITTNKTLRFCNGNGDTKPIQVSSIVISSDSETNMYRGVNDMLNAKSLYLPQNGYDVAGCIRFNPSTKKFEGYNGESWVTLG